MTSSAFSSRHAVRIKLRSVLDIDQRGFTVETFNTSIVVLYIVRGLPLKNTWTSMRATGRHHEFHSYFR